MATTELPTIEIQLFGAQGALESFNQSISRRDLIARLKRARPLHPTLLASRAFSSAAGLLMIGALVWTGMVVAGLPLPHPMVAMAEPGGLPAPIMMLALALCSGTLMVAAREFAALAGEHSPMLPAEARAHQRLMSDVLRLKAARAVRNRIAQS